MTHPSTLWWSIRAATSTASSPPSTRPASPSSASCSPTAIWTTPAARPNWRRPCASAPATRRPYRSKAPTSATCFLLQGIEAQAAGFGFAARNVTPDRWLHEGDSVTLGTNRFDVLHCPGHTPGHIVFVNHAARFALARRRAVPGLGRPHRFSLWRPRRADRRHHRQAAAARRRPAIPVRPWPGFHHRGRAARQSISGWTIIR